MRAALVGLKGRCSLVRRTWSMSLALAASNKGLALAIKAASSLSPPGPRRQRGQGQQHALCFGAGKRQHWGEWVLAQPMQVRQGFSSGHVLGTVPGAACKDIQEQLAHRRSGMHALSACILPAGTAARRPTCPQSIATEVHLGTRIGGNRLAGRRCLAHLVKVAARAGAGACFGHAAQPSVASLNWTPPSASRA